MALIDHVKQVDLLEFVRNVTDHNGSPLFFPTHDSKEVHIIALIVLKRLNFIV